MYTVCDKKALMMIQWGKFKLLLQVIHTYMVLKPLLSLSYIPSYVHVCPGYKEKSADLQGPSLAHL